MPTSPLRVLHVVATTERRGAETFAADLVRALEAEGVDQRVAILRNAGPNGHTYDAPSSILDGNGARLPGFRADPRTILALRRLVRSWNPDIIQAHGGEPLKYAVVAGALRKSPIVYRRIGQAPAAIRDGVVRAAHGMLMKRAERIVAVADSIRRETIETFRVSPTKVVTIAGGADGRRLAPSGPREELRRRLGITSDASVVLSLGALTWEKDPLAHLQVTALVAKHLPGVRHIFAGDGPLRADVDAERRHLGLESNVLLLGRRTDIGDVLAAADVVLLASRTEGMPGCLIEAGMAGIPSAAFALSGVPEVVIDQRTGLLAPPGDVGSLAERVLELLLDGERRAAMGRSARDWCMARFDIQVVAPRYLSLYQEVRRA